VSHLAWALYRFGVVWLFYIALEPYLRRIWPRSMVSWVRLIDGRFRDPLVGRDVLIGVLAVFLLWLTFQATVFVGVWLGAALPPHSLEEFTLEALRGLPQAMAMMFYRHDFLLLYGGMFLIVLLLLARLVLRRTWLAVGVVLLFFASARYTSGEVSLMLGWSFQASFIAVWLLLFFRAGLLPLMVFLGTCGLWVPLTFSLDPGNWYSSATYVALLITLGAAAYGFYVSLAGRPMFRDTILEE
jgi:serine/threonine-protein kinase